MLVIVFQYLIRSGNALDIRLERGLRGAVCKAFFKCYFPSVCSLPLLKLSTALNLVDTCDLHEEAVKILILVVAGLCAQKSALITFELVHFSCQQIFPLFDALRLLSSLMGQNTILQFLWMPTELFTELLYSAKCQQQHCSPKREKRKPPEEQTNNFACLMTNLLISHKPSKRKGHQREVNPIC